MVRDQWNRIDSARDRMMPKRKTIRPGGGHVAMSAGQAFRRIGIAVAAVGVMHVHGFDVADNMPDDAPAVTIPVESAVADMPENIQVNQSLIDESRAMSDWLRSDGFWKQVDALARSRNLDLDELLEGAARTVSFYREHPFDGEVKPSDLDDEV